MENYWEPDTKFIFLTRLRLKVMSLCSALCSTHYGSISPSHGLIISHVTSAVCVDQIVFSVTAGKVQYNSAVDWLLWLSLFWDRDGPQLDIHWSLATQPWYTVPTATVLISYECLHLWRHIALVVPTRNIVVGFSQYYTCRCPVDIRRQGISRYSIDSKI